MPGGRHYGEALQRRLARLEAEGNADAVAATQAKLDALEPKPKRAAASEDEAKTTPAKTTAREK